MIALAVHQSHFHYQPDPPNRSHPLLSSVMSVSMLPNIRPPAQRRPKLSLQTSSFPALNLHLAAVDSPTNRNTQVNTLVSSPRPKPATPHYSPVSDETTIPYALPIGARSILKNSPLPPRHVSATSARAPRRIFPPPKRVNFREAPVEVMPTPLVELSESSSDSDSDSSTSSQKRRRTSMPEDVRQRARLGDGSGSATPVQGRGKRRRQWVWTLDDESGSVPGYGCSSPDAGRILRDGRKDQKDDKDSLVDDPLSLDYPSAKGPRASPIATSRQDLVEQPDVSTVSMDSEHPTRPHATSASPIKNQSSSGEATVKDNGL